MQIPLKDRLGGFNSKKLQHTYELTIPTDVKGYEFEIKQLVDGTVFASLIDKQGDKRVSLTGELRSWVNKQAQQHKEKKNGS